MVTVQIDNYSPNIVSHPGMPVIQPFANGAPGTESAVLDQITADDCNENYDTLASRGIAVSENGTYRIGVQEITAADTILATTHIALIDTDGPGFTVVIPDASDVDAGHRLYIFLRTDGGGNATLDPAGADTLLGVPTRVLTTAGQMIVLESDGANNWASFTDTTGATAGYRVSAVQNYNLEPAQTLLVSVDAGANQTFTFTATAASILSAAETYTLVNGQDIDIEVNGVEQTVTFATGDFVDIGNATAEELVIVFNRDLTGVTASGTTDVTLTTTRRGTGASLEVTGGTAAAALGFGGPATGTGNVANIDAVTAAEVVSLLSTLTGATATVQAGAVKVTSATTGILSSITVTGTAAATVGFSGTGVGTA